MIQDMSLIALVSDASIPVQVVMLLLLLTSLLSWRCIYIKLFGLRRANKEARIFEAQFFEYDLNSLYEKVISRSRNLSGMSSICAAGLNEYIRHKKLGSLDNVQIMEATRRAMRSAYNREVDELETHLPFLASAGSVSPYIGLLGTVWGIMHSFRSLSNVSQATLSLVAPGIAEALIATAIGLFAAIPAVVAYNRFSANVDKLAVRYESFMEDFTNVLQGKS